MSAYKIDGVIGGLVVGFIVGCIIGYIGGSSDEMKKLRCEAVKHKAAYWAINKNGYVVFVWNGDDKE